MNTSPYQPMSTSFKLMVTITIYFLRQLCYYAYERKLECYKGKDGDVQYTRTARVDKKDNVSIIVDRLLQNSAPCLKHRSYADNVSRVLPTLKDGFNEKYIKLDFSENLAGSTFFWEAI